MINHEWDIMDLQGEEWQREQIAGLSHLLQREPPRRVLRWTLDWLYPHVAFSCQFRQEDVVLLHMMSELEARPTVFAAEFSADTQSLAEIYQSRFGLRINTKLSESEAALGPLHRYKAWITGIRRDQNPP